MKRIAITERTVHREASELRIRNSNSAHKKVLVCRKKNSDFVKAFQSSFSSLYVFLNAFNNNLAVSGSHSMALCFSIL